MLDPENTKALKNNLDKTKEEIDGLMGYFQIRTNTINPFNLKACTQDVLRAAKLLDNFATEYLATSAESN